MEIIKLEQEWLEYFRGMDPLFLLPRIALGRGFALGSIIADEKGLDLPIGLIICAETDEALIIQWMYIDEGHRNQGYGSEILGTLIDLSSEMKKKYIRVYWTNRLDEGSADGYFISNGISKKQELAGECRLTIEELLNKDVLKKKKISSRILLIRQLTSGQMREYPPICEKMPIYDTVFGLALSEFAFDEDISLLAVDENKKPVGGLFARASENEIFVCAIAGTTSSSIIDLIKGFLGAVRERYPADTVLNFLFASEVFSNFAQLLFSDYRAENYYLYESLEERK